MDFEIPLNRLKFGQEDGAGTNARITGRQDGIAELAANLHANGQIENLVVRRCGDDPGLPVPEGWKGARDMYSVSNGNRRLAAFHMIYSETSTHLVRVTSHDVDENVAFEQSLTTAVTAKQLHPVDQYEAFARLRDRGGKTEEEIARQYGMTEREVQQALALGHLSPRIRDAWRKGEIKATAAKAFTLAPDHKAQDTIFDNLKADAEAGRGCDLIEVEGDEVKSMLKIGNDNSGTMVEFVGIDAYVKRGGKVTRDLFGTDHKVSDPKLAKAMAAEKLKNECAGLVAAGWSFAVTTEAVRNSQHSYGRLNIEKKPSEDELKRLDELNAVFNPGNAVRHGYYQGESLAELNGSQQRAYLEYCDLDRTITLRSYQAKLMATAGCFVGIDDDGLIDIEYGRVKPAKKEAAAQEQKTVKRETKQAEIKQAAAEGKPAPESTTVSNALADRLRAQLVAATRGAIAEAAELPCELLKSPLAGALAKIVCAQIRVNGSHVNMPDEIRTKMTALREALPAAIISATIAKHFDADDYFANAPKGLVLKAIAEAINPDEARKLAAKTKSDVGKFAKVNVAKTGWLPKELRTTHYKPPALKAAAPFVPGPPKPGGIAPAQPKAKKATASPATRAAASKKPAKKTAAKKSKAKKARKG